MSQISNRPVDWETLVKENEDRLYRAALAILGDAQEAEDAVQDTFLKFLEKAPAELDSPPAWLMRVLVNGCRDRLRAAWRRRSVPLWESLPAPEPEERQELEEIFSLPPADRAVIHLFYYEGLSTGAGGEYWLPAVCWQQDWPGPAASGSRMGPPRLTAWTVPGCSPPRAGPRTRGAPRPWRRMKSSSRPLCGR